MPHSHVNILYLRRLRRPFELKSCAKRLSAQRKTNITAPMSPVLWNVWAAPFRSSEARNGTLKLPGPPISSWQEYSSKRNNPPGELSNRHRLRPSSTGAEYTAGDRWCSYTAHIGTDWTFRRRCSLPCHYRCAARCSG